MSTARITTDKYGRNVVANGRKFFLPRIIKIEPGKDSYSFNVTRSCGTIYEVWGGKASGGPANQWYIEGFPSGKPIHCTGLVDALKLLNGM